MNNPWLKAQVLLSKLFFIKWRSIELSSICLRFKYIFIWCCISLNEKQQKIDSHKLKFDVVKKGRDCLKQENLTIANAAKYTETAIIHYVPSLKTKHKVLSGGSYIVYEQNCTVLWFLGAFVVCGSGQRKGCIHRCTSSQSSRSVVWAKQIHTAVSPLPVKQKDLRQLQACAGKELFFICFVPCGMINVPMSVA